MEAQGELERFQGSLMNIETQQAGHAYIEGPPLLFRQPILQCLFSGGLREMAEVLHEQWNIRVLIHQLQRLGVTAKIKRSTQDRMLRNHFLDCESHSVHPER